MRVVLFAVFLLSSLVSLQAQDRARAVGWYDQARSMMVTDVARGQLYLDSLKGFTLKHPTDRSMLADYSKLKGIYLYRQSAYDSAIRYYETAGDLYAALDSVLDQAKVKVNTAMAYNRKGDFEKTIDLSLEALRLFEKLGDVKGIGICNNMVGQVYFYQKDYGKALLYFRDYLKNSVDSVERAGGYNNIGSAYEQLKIYDSALIYNQKGLAIHLAMHNPFGAGNSYQDIASIFVDKADYDKATYYYTLALAQYRKGNNPSGIMETSLNLGKEWNDRKNPQKAEPFLQEALTLAKQLGESYVEQEALESLANSAEEMGQYETALEYYKAYKVASDTLYNANTRKNIEELNIRYGTEKKNQDIALLNQTTALQQASIQKRSILIIALVIFLILLLVIFYLWRNRLRIRQASVLQEQRTRMREAQLSAVIDSQEKERTRFASDLHDGMGQLLSALQMNIHSLRENSPDLDKRDQLFESSEQLMDDLHREIRNVAFNLMPPVLLHEGLVPALRELANRIEKIGKIRTGLHVHDFQYRLSEIAEISMYRIIQEFLSNIMKYSGATKIELSFTGHDGELVLTIEDDGNGYDVAAFKNAAGNGWRNIQTRLNLIHAVIDIDTRPGRKNNTVVITLPVTHHEMKIRSEARPTL